MNPPNLVEKYATLREETIIRVCQNSVAISLPLIGRVESKSIPMHCGVNGRGEAIIFGIFLLFSLTISLACAIVCSIPAEMRILTRKQPCNTGHGRPVTFGRFCKITLTVTLIVTLVYKLPVYVSRIQTQHQQPYTLKQVQSFRSKVM